MYLSKFFNLGLLKSKSPEITKHVHGVFVEIKGKGILIIGKSGIGKRTTRSINNGLFACC